MQGPKLSKDDWPSTPQRVPGSRGKLFLILGVLCSLAVVAPAQSATEYQVKAAFLFNFAKFVEWPPGSFPSESAPFHICIFGRDPLGTELQEIARNKMVNGRKLEISQISDLQQARSCHILFVSSSARMPMKQILESLRGISVLTVGDSKGFAERGGMINFLLENDRVQFEVNRKAAEEAGLKIDSKLLSVARLVSG